jgi:hypothetical protein
VEDIGVSLFGFGFCLLVTSIGCLFSAGTFIGTALTFFTPMFLLGGAETDTFAFDLYLIHGMD